MEAKKEKVIAITEADPFVQMVERIAGNPNIDADKLDKLVGIQMRILDRNAEAEFNRAMAEVQAKLPTVLRESKNTQTNSKYAKHEAIAREIKPTYTAAGFSITFGEGDTDKPDCIRVNATLMHSGGHSRDYHYDVPLDNKGIQGKVNKTDTHAKGSSTSYGRRYLTCLIFDVATGDDVDGNQPKRYAKLDAEQAEDIRDLLKQTNSDETRFLAWAGNYESVEDLPAEQFPSIRMELQRKLNKQQDGAK